MTHWSWSASGLALALVPVLHWLFLGRGLAVSGRYTALVDRLRFGRAAELPDDTAALLAALRAETQKEFGANAVTAATPPADEHMPSLRAPDRVQTHLLFLVGLAAGGLISAWLAGAAPATASLHGALFARTIEALNAPAPVVLVAGGVLVGFGTRMAGGCTSGHGLCGVSTLQPGSLLATAAFFGAGVIVSFALSALP